MTINKHLFDDTLEARFVLENEPLSRHTTFKTGGPADLLLLPQNETQLLDCLRVLREHRARFFIMGRGSNLLVSDAGYRGTIIKIMYGAAAASGNTVTADAGVPLKSVALCAAGAGLAGLEFAAGIPGSLGGGVVMNAGAYGGELKDSVACVRILDDSLQPKELSPAEAGFGYRHSVIGANGSIVLGATFRLPGGNQADIQAKMEALAARRREKQPLELPSAGSTFKRPPDNFAGALIEQCGLKGFSIGGAQVSPRHAGFIVNTGGASSQDIYRLILHVQDAVFGQTGIRLEPEVKLLGEFT